MTDLVADPVDLSECAREPIHIPGAIQPHGAILAARIDGGIVTHASANLAAILGIDATAILAKPLSSALGGAALETLQSDTTPGDLKLGGTCFIAGPSGNSLHLRAFRSGTRLCVDIQPVPSETWPEPPLRLAHSVLESLKDAQYHSELCELAVRGLRAISGYDRVMAYRFAPDGHGEVIAEARAGHLVPYFGQRYPASDIPAQARQLYLRQRIGVIVDSAYEAVPLLTDARLDDGVPLDLTQSTLRSVSPMHRQFMRNMGTVASMTVGLARTREDGEQELWGMLVCHHETPRRVGPELRAMVDMIGQMLSLMLDNRRSAELNAGKLARNSTFQSLVENLRTPGRLIDTLAAHQRSLLQLVDASGVLIRFRGNVLGFGTTPQSPGAAAVFERLYQGPGESIRAIDDLGVQHPELAAEAQGCSGALIMPLGKTTDGVIWLRPETKRTVVWGGNPAKPTVPDPATGSIAPRASFEPWQEQLSGRSVPWSETDIELARELRRCIEEELLRRTDVALDLFHRIFESSPTALILVGNSGRINMLNKHAERMFGYAAGELEGRSIEDLLPTRLAGSHVALRLAYQAAPTLRDMARRSTLSGRRKDGTEFPVEISLNPIAPDEFAGEPVVQASIIDVSERLASERARLDAQQRLQSVANHVPAMIGYWNRELRCEFANEAYRSWFGRAPQTIIGTHMRDILGEELYADNEPYVLKALAGDDQRFTRIIKRADGTEGYADARYIADRDAQGGVIGFYVLVTDITTLQQSRAELEAANTQLADANRELDQFVYTASHDLRAPLRAISALTSFVLEDDPGLNAETRERISLIDARAGRLQRLLDGILEYARAGKGGDQGHTRSSVAALIDEVVGTLLVPAGFTVVKDPSLERIEVFPIPLTQVFHNLIGNAIKHHDRPHGIITVAARSLTGPTGAVCVRFSVTDDGPGVPEAYRESVFEMFTTLKRRDEVEASGMGLALVRKLVTRRGGKCGIESMPGRGACLWFDWPEVPGKGALDAGTQ